MKLRKMFKSKAAFTLVELVVVIAIMAILAGAVAGAVVGIRATANTNDAKDTASEVAKTWATLIADGKITPKTTAANVASALDAALNGITVGTAEAADDKYAIVENDKITVYTKTKTVVITLTDKENGGYSIADPADR